MNVLRINGLSLSLKQARVLSAAVRMYGLVQLLVPNGADSFLNVSTVISVEKAGLRSDGQ